MNDQSGVFRFIRGLASFAGMAAFLEITGLIKFSDSSILQNFLTSGCIIISCVGLIVFIKQSLTDKSLWGSVVIFSNIIAIIGYWMMRAMLTDDVQIYIKDWLAITSDDFPKFVYAFSIGYSTFQFIIGYFVSKMGTRFIGIFGILNALALMIMSSFDSSTDKIYILLIRFMSGVFCSTTIMSIGYHINKFKCIPARFGVVANFAIVFASAFAIFTLKHFSVINHVSFSLLTKTISLTFVIPGVIFLLDSFINKLTPQEFTMSDYGKYFTDLLRSKRYMVMFIQAVLVIIGCSTLRENFLTDIGGSFDLKLYIEKGMIYGIIFLSTLMATFGYLRSTVVLAISNLLGFVILFLHVFVSPVHFVLLVIAIFSIGLGQAGHAVVQSMVGEYEGSNPAKAASMVAILNTATMLVGATIFGQAVVPRLTYLNAMYILCGVAFISFVLSIYSVFVNSESVKVQQNLKK
jgi:hypothetical protein